jgi:hypothetical protein
MQSSKNILRTALGCAAALLLVSTTAWADNGKCNQANKLDGAWVVAWVGQASDGTPARIEFASNLIPTDPSGRTAGFQLEWLTVGKDFEALMGLLGIQGSKVVGRYEMTGHNTTKYTMIWYGVSKEFPGEIRAIYTLSGVMTFQGPDKLVDRSTIKVFLTNSGVARVAPVVGGPWPYGDADADHDLLPDAGAVPFVNLSFEGAMCKRVSFLP